MRVIAALLLLAATPALAEPCDRRDGYTACYADPTDRYPHAVLGDALEWGRLVVTLPDGRTAAAVLPEARVFEDIAPRLYDIEGNGVPEAIVVETDVEAGAQLAVYGIDRGALVKIAATPEIGRRFRWLAPVGIADLDGDGITDIAYVEKPHLDGILRVWTFAPGGLTEVASAPGFSNHRSGEDFITAGLRLCAGEPVEMILPDLRWTRLTAVRLEAGRLTARVLGPRPDRTALEAALAC
jgi:hypothetical protein